MQTFAPQKVMSGLPPKADISQCDGVLAKHHVRELTALPALTESSMA